jgi:hypothetical protein
MLVPKAAVNEDGNSMFHEHQIGSSLQIASMQAETKPHCMGNLPNTNFRLGVFAPNLSHYLAALRWAEPVHVSLSVS